MAEYNARFKSIYLGPDGAQVRVRAEAGAPEGAITAPVGQQYLNTTDGRLWRKATGSGNTGWLPSAPTVYTSSYGSAPSAPFAGDLWLPSDSFYQLRYSGSTWVPWGPFFPFTQPDDSAFAWINQGSATVSAANGGIHLMAPAQAADSLRVRKMTAPATPYVITAAFLFNGFAPPATSQSFGLLFRQSSDGKIHACQHNVLNSDVLLTSRKWTSATVFSADYAIEKFHQAGSAWWLRIADNGTNRICSFSGDGINWTDFHTIGRTNFLTADEVGFFVNDFTNTYPVRTTLLSFKVS